MLKKVDEIYFELEDEYEDHKRLKKYCIILVLSKFGKRIFVRSGAVIEIISIRGL